MPRQLLKFLITIFVIHQLILAANETTRQLQFENEQVKVWKTIIEPNQPLQMHRHDFHRVVVGLKGGLLTKIEQSGETSPLLFETGSAYWLNPDPIDQLHADINQSNEPIEVMVIELKNAKGGSN